MHFLCHYLTQSKSIASNKNQTKVNYFIPIVFYSGNIKLYIKTLYLHIKRHLLVTKSCYESINGLSVPHGLFKHFIQYFQHRQFSGLRERICRKKLKPQKTIYNNWNRFVWKFWCLSAAAATFPINAFPAWVAQFMSAILHDTSAQTSYFQCEEIVPFSKHHRSSL